MNNHILQLYYVIGGKNLPFLINTLQIYLRNKINTGGLPFNELLIRYAKKTLINFKLSKYVFTAQKQKEIISGFHTKGENSSK